MRPVAQLVEQRDLFRRSWVRIPPGSEIFPLSPCGPISLLGLSLRRYYLGYLSEHFQLPHLNHYLLVIKVNLQIFTKISKFFGFQSSFIFKKQEMEPEGEGAL